MDNELFKVIDQAVMQSINYYFEGKEHEKENFPGVMVSTQILGGEKGLDKEYNEKMAGILTEHYKDYLVIYNEYLWYFIYKPQVKGLEKMKNLLGPTPFEAADLIKNFIKDLKEN